MYFDYTYYLRFIKELLYASDHTHHSPVPMNRMLSYEPVKAAFAVGKNHKVMLMMMGAFAPSAATTSDATTTSGLGSGLGIGSQTKNSLSYLKLIICCFLPDSRPHTKFHPNRTKT